MFEDFVDLGHLAAVQEAGDHRVCFDVPDIFGVGAAAGADAEVKSKEGWLADLVKDAVANGQVVLVALTKSPEETDIAREVVGDAVGEFKDVAAPA